MKLKNIYIIVLVVLALAYGAKNWTYSESVGNPQELSEENVVQNIKLLDLYSDISNLEITAKQKKQVRAVLKNYRDEAEPLILKMVQHQQLLKNTIRMSYADEVALRTVIQEMSETQLQLALIRSKIFHEVEPLLTDDQKEQLKGIEAKIAEKLPLLIVNFGNFITRP